MSLDFYLKDKITGYCQECGHTHACQGEVFHANITHNLIGMAKEAGIYEALWQSDGTQVAHEIAPILETGLSKMRARPEHFKKFDAPNGWGKYEHFIPFVQGVLTACKEHPSAKVWSST